MEHKSLNFIELDEVCISFLPSQEPDFLTIHDFEDNSCSPWTDEHENNWM